MRTDKGIKMVDALVEHYGNVSEREGLLRTRIALVTAVTKQHEYIYGPVYDRFNITEKISNCINSMRLGNADGTFERAIRENLQRYTTKQHKIDRLNDMAYLDENIRQAVDQQGETSKEIEQAARTGDYKAVKQKTDLFLEQGEKIIELREDKFQKQIYDLQQMKWDNMLNADVWIKQPQPHKCELEDGTKVFMDYRLNDVAAKSLRAGHENDIISDGYPNGYYLGTMNGYPQLIIHTQDKIIVSRSMTDDYSEGKSLADISNDLYQEYWNDMNRVEMKDMSMDNQIATELVTALAKVDAAYEVEQVDSLKEIEQRSGQSYRELYYEKRDECRLDKALVPKVGIASELEDGTYSLREVRIIDDCLADIIKNNTEQVDIGNLSADVKPGDFLLLKDNIMEPYQTFMVTEDGLMQAGDSRKAEVCNRYCTGQMLSSSFDVDMEQKCVKPLVEHGVTLQPGIQTRFEKNAKMFEMKNPVAPEQDRDVDVIRKVRNRRCIAHLFLMKGRCMEMNLEVREYANVYIVFSPRKDVQRLIDGYGENITGTLRVIYKDSYIVTEFMSDNTELACRVETETDNIYMDEEQIIITEENYGDWIFRYDRVREVL